MLFGLYCRMEWLQQGSRELFGTIIEDQVCAGFSLKHIIYDRNGYALLRSTIG